MGHVPPSPPPHGIITLPAGATWTNVTAMRDHVHAMPAILQRPPKFEWRPQPAPRLWADRHLEALGWGLVGVVVTGLAAILGIAIA